MKNDISQLEMWNAIEEKRVVGTPPANGGPPDLSNFSAAVK